MLFDVVIATALPEEFDAVKRQLKGAEECPGLPGSTRTYTHKILDNGLHVGLVCQPAMGQLDAVALGTDIIHDCQPSAIILCGIAGAIKSAHDAPQLGDLVISEQIVDYEEMKLTPDGNKPRWKAFPSDSHLRQTLLDFRNRDWSKGFRQKQGEKKEKKLNAECVKTGNIMSGNKVVADCEVANRFRKNWDKAIAIEMEAAGMALSCFTRRRPIPFVMVKGISDFADAEKDNTWRSYASELCAFYLVKYLTECGSESIPARQALPHKELMHAHLQLAAPTLLPQHKMRYRLATRVLKTTLEEIGQIVESNYDTNLGHGEQFLLRAPLVFKAASRVRAVSMDTVSTFWIDPKNKEAAQSYVKDQSKDTARLFVFSSADSLHRYGKVLDVHCDSYENVFVTSIDRYHKIAEKFLSPGLQNAFECDFALLEYDNGTSHPLLARLDESRLKFRETSESHDAFLRVSEFRKFFENILETERGKVKANVGVLRWQVELWRQHARWAKIMGKMFPSREREVLHIVHFHVADDNKQAGYELRRLKSLLMANDSWRTDYGLLDVWFGRGHRPHSAPREWHYGGKLLTQERFNYCLVMRFANADGLDKYYRDPLHSEIRRDVHRSFDTRLRDYYDLPVNGQSEEDGRKMRQTVCSAIESVAKEFMERHDFVDSESMDEMVRCTPYNPHFERGD